MDTCIIKFPCVEENKSFIELEIVSENLIYAEIADTHIGVQCNIKNHDIILKKCIEVADLIREIDKLNKE